MPVNLSVKNVPDDLAQRLREQARGNHRSLQRELVAILEQAVTEGASQSRSVSGTKAAAQGRRAIDDVIAELHTIFPHARGDGEPGVELIRRMRDSRHAPAAPKRRNRAAS